MIRLVLIITTTLFSFVFKVYSQSYKKIVPNEVGINFFTQRTQTIMHYHQITPYYNTWGFNNGMGLDVQYNISDKWHLKIWYNYAKLINSYDISKKDPLFSRNDKKDYKPFSYYWVSNEIGIGYKFKFYTKKQNNFYFEQALCTNYGQLVYDNFPFKGLYSDTFRRDIVYQDGIPATMTYNIWQVSVRNMGLNFLNGLTYEKEINAKWKAKLNMAVNYGFIPLIASRIDFTFTSPERKGSVIGEHYALSSNSGVRVGFNLSYVITKSK